MNTDILSHEYCYEGGLTSDLVLMSVGRECNTRATGVTIFWRRSLIMVLHKLPHISTDQMVGNQLVTRNCPIVFL